MFIPLTHLTRLSPLVPKLIFENAILWPPTIKYLSYMVIFKHVVFLFKCVQLEIVFSPSFPCKFIASFKKKKKIHDCPNTLPLTIIHAMPYKICIPKGLLKYWAGFHKIPHKWVEYYGVTSHDHILKAETIFSLQFQYLKKGTLIW